MEAHENEPSDSNCRDCGIRDRRCAFICRHPRQASLLYIDLLGLVAPTSTTAPLAGDVIPLKPIADLTSLNATVKLDVNGLINGERAQGDLNVDLRTNDQGKSRISVTGPLLGELAAQVGGSLVGLFTPSSVDIYKVPQGTYIVVNGLFPICIKPQESKATAALDEMKSREPVGHADRQ